MLAQGVKQDHQPDAADAVIQIAGKPRAEHIYAKRQNPLPAAQGDEDAQSQRKGDEDAGRRPAVHVERADSFKRVFPEGKCKHVKRLRDQCQQHDTPEILDRIARIDRADGNAVGEQREGEPSDQAHFGNLRKEHFSGVIDEHEQAGQKLD